MKMVMNLLMYLIYGVLIGVPAGIISGIILIPMYALISASGSLQFLGILGIAVGFVILGWWARLVVRRIHILGG